MKVLWITNILFDQHRAMIGLPPVNLAGGSWLYAAYEGSLKNESLQLHIATVGNVSETKCSERDGNYFYILPGGNISKYDINSENNLKSWIKLREDISPDAVIVWGTEQRFSYLAMKALQGLPIAIYIQGIINSICSHYYEGVPHEYQCRTIRDVLDRMTSSSQTRKFWTQLPLEREMLKMATAVIVENDWCEDQCKSINPKLIVYKNMLPIRDVFYSKTWNGETFDRYTIFTNAGGYPIKGHHILFKALGLVKKSYPDFKCYIPGVRLDTFRSLKRKTGYMSYLLKIIKEYQLEDNIKYVGNLSSSEMADYITKCNAYVMPSIVENHSSSLIEAMIVGAPCISSLVGGTGSLVKHNVNGILYNSLDAESLSGNIIRLFENRELANKLSRNAYQIREDRLQNFEESMNIIYSSLIQKNL